ncbi:MAG: glycoside hydrolase family 3 protein [Enterocloster asparagiformis]|nr:glycoside hydrolase family 3 protein [Enterocloster asparagiformis]
MGIALVAVAVLSGTGIYVLAGRLSVNMEKNGTSSEPPAQDNTPVASTGREERPQVTETEPEPAAPAGEELLEEKLDQILSGMTTEEKVAQLFIVTPEALTGVESVTQAGESTREALSRRPVGGLIYFRNNLKNPEQVKALTGNTARIGREVCALPLLLSVDEEGGKVTRIGGREGFDVPVFPNMAEIGAVNDAQKAYEVGSAIGGYLSEYGFNMDFAPDADVLTNSANQVIGSRSFGTDAQLVWSMASQVARGLKDRGVQPVYKHFPGHGATLGDTHDGFAYTEKTLDELMEAELVPFANAVKSGENCIMAAHIAAPGVTGDETPASLSYGLITGVLREKLGFDGVVVTDALNMGAIQNLYSSGQAAVAAVEAGADLLLMPADFDAAYEAVLQAVQEGKISRERLDLSVRRIGRMKLESVS